jgi:hypothetical protein
MHFIWGNIFDHFKERRIAAFFFGALFVVPPAGFLLSRIQEAENLKNYVLYATPGLLLIFVSLMARAVQRARARGRDGYKISPMSRDELRKARSKLVKH